VLAFVLSLTLLGTIRRLGRQARASREALLTGFTRIVATLPHRLALLGALLVAALASTLGMVTLLVFFRLQDKYRAMVEVITWFGVGVGVLLLLAGLWQVWKVWRAMERGLAAPSVWAIGRSLTRTQAPLLWQLVDEVVRRAQVSAPDNLIIAMDDKLFVTEAPFYLNDSDLPATGRSLSLSAPCLAWLHRDEAMAVIGHELAHFTGQDTEYSLQFATLFAALRQQYAAWYDALGDAVDTRRWLPARVAHRLLGHLLDTVETAVQHWSRERELLADQHGAAAATPQAAARALLRLTTLAPVMAAALDDYHENAHAKGTLLQHVTEYVQSAPDLAPEAHLQDIQPHPRDSHPPALQRIDALGVTVTPALLAAASTREPGGLLRELGLQ